MPVDTRRIGEDEFTMWRAVFAFSLADGQLTLEEQKILSYHIETVPFSKEQMEILRDDMGTPHDVEDLFHHITIKSHREQFCALARTLVWCDGDIALQEKEILQHVGCFKTRDALDMLKNSSQHDLYKKFTKTYEATSQLKSLEPVQLFATAA